MKSKALKILRAEPDHGAAAGELLLHCDGFRPGLPGEAAVLVGDVEAHIISASENRVVIRLPECAGAVGIQLRVGDRVSPVHSFTLASRLATDLHPVANPVIDTAGNIITTISGSRGQQVDQPLVRISPAGEKRAFSCQIMNPTSLAFGPDGHLYVSSRNDGVVYRYRDFEQLDVVAEDLGIASGIVFDSRGVLYVGDRSGRILRIRDSGEAVEHARLEPSVSAYHLAVDPSDRLYVTGPTFSMRDSIFRITAPGEVERLCGDFARPQGLTVLPDGRVLVAAAREGRKGIFECSPEGDVIALRVCAPMLVGLALSGDWMILADNTSLYRLPFRTGAEEGRVESTGGRGLPS